MFIIEQTLDCEGLFDTWHSGKVQTFSLKYTWSQYGIDSVIKPVFKSFARDSAIMAFKPNFFSS